MRTISSIHPPREATLPGGQVVRRALPRKERRHVGPFVFLDHAGPHEVTHPGAIGAHPHAGLQTVTYLLSGESEHADSIGSRARIRPGGVNWMTSGRGIIHDERVLPGDPIHLIQIWIALPPEHRDTTPSFVSYPAESLPILNDPHWTLRVVAGRAFDAVSPVQSFQPITYLDLELKAGGAITLPVDPAHELAVYVISGGVEIDGQALGASMLGFLSDGDPSAVITTAAGARVLVIGGTPAGLPLTIWWNFVTGTLDEGRALEEAWKTGRFDAQGWQPEW